MYRRSIAVLAGLLTASLALAACSGSSDESTPPDEQDLSTITEPATGTIRYESWTPTADQMKKVTAGLADEDPDLAVEPQLLPYENYLTSLKSELASGEGPDVFVLPPGAYLNQFKQFIEPIGPYASASIGENWQSEFRKEAITASTVDDQVLGLPSAPFGIAGILWVNTTLLSEHGLTVPTTYDELVEVAAALESEGIAPIAFGGKDGYQLVDFYLTLANDRDPEATAAAYRATGSWEDEPLVQAFADMARIFSDGLVQSGALGAMTYNDTYNLWLDGKAAFLANGSWNMDMFVNSADKIAKIDAQVIPFPSPAGSQRAVVGDVGGVLVMNKASANKVGAYKLVEYMSHGGGAQILTDSFLDPGVLAEPLSPTIDLTDNATEVRESINSLVADNLAGGRNLPNAATQDALVQALQQLLAGNTDPQGAAQQVQTASDDS